MSKVYAFLAALVGVLGAVAYAFAKGAESAKSKAEANAEKAKAKSLARQSKAAQKRQAKARKRIDEASRRDFSSTDINGLFDDSGTDKDH